MPDDRGIVHPPANSKPVRRGTSPRTIKTRSRPPSARAVLAGHNQPPLGEWRQGNRVRARRGTAASATLFARVSGREASQIRRTARGKMRDCDPKLVAKFGQAGLDLTVLVRCCGSCHGRPPLLPSVSSCARREGSVARRG
jgi:hypothetical protein